MRVRYQSIAAIAGSLSLSLSLLAEQGKLVLHVADVQGRPVAHLSIAPVGAGSGSQETDLTGRVILLLAPEAKANSLVQLQIVRSPKGHDFVMFDPWREHPVRVPPFENDAMNFVSVVVAEQGDRAMLENPRSLVAQINQANAPKTSVKQAAQMSPKENLDAVSRQYGLAPEEVDRAIKAWGKKATDPYDAGLAALYERNYPEAAKQLTTSLDVREKILREDRNTVKADEDSVADAASSLGQSLYAQALYAQALAAENRVLEIRPTDAFTLNEKALCLAELGMFREAEALLHTVISMAIAKFGDNHPNTLNSESNLAGVLERAGNYKQSTEIFQQILNKRSTTDCYGSVKSADVNNLAEVLLAQGYYGNAEQLILKAMVVDEDAPISEEWNAARSLTNMASILKLRGNYAAAVMLLRRALAINQAIFMVLITKPSHLY